MQFLNFLKPFTFVAKISANINKYNNDNNNNGNTLSNTY